MTKTLECKDVTGNCDYKVRAENDQELMRKVSEHARDHHNVREITPELASKVRGAIREER